MALVIVSSTLSLVTSLISLFTNRRNSSEAEKAMIDELKKLKESLESRLHSSKNAADDMKNGLGDLHDLSSKICDILKIQQKAYENDRSVDLQSTEVMTNKLTDINSSVGEILSGQDELKKQQELIVKLQEEMAKLQRAEVSQIGAAGPSGYQPGVFCPPQPGYMGYPPPYPVIPPQFSHPIPDYHHFPPPPPHFTYDRPFYEDNLLRRQQRSFSGSSCSIASSIESLIPTNFHKYDKEEKRTEETTAKPSKKVLKCTDCSEKLDSKSDIASTIENDDSHCENCMEVSKSAGHMYFDAVGYMKKKGWKKPVLEEIMDENVRLDVEQPKPENKGKTYLPRRNARSVTDSSEVRSNIGDDLEELPSYEQSHNYRSTENWLRNNDQEMRQFGGATYDGREYSAYNDRNCPPGNFHQRGYQSQWFRGNEEPGVKWFGPNRGGRYRQDNYHRGERMYRGERSMEDNFQGNHRGRRMYSGPDHRGDNYRSNHQGGRMFSDHREDSFRGNYRGRRIHSDHREDRRNQPMFNDQQQSNRFERNDVKSSVKEDEVEESIVPAMESLNVAKKGKKKQKGTNPQQRPSKEKEDSMICYPQKS